MNSLKNCSNPYKVCVRRGIALLKSSLFIVVPILVVTVASCGDADRHKSSYEEKSKAVELLTVIDPANTTKWLKIQEN